MTTQKYPPISPGTLVKTTQENSDDWTKEALKTRRWGVRGAVIAHHDSHGLCYDVRHEDGTRGSYDPSELEVDDEKALVVECLADVHAALHPDHIQTREELVRRLRERADFIEGEIRVANFLADEVATDN